MVSRVPAALLALLVVLVAVGAVAGPAAAVATVQGQSATDGVVPERPSETTFRVTLRPDGDARVTVTRNYSLASEARRAAFEEIAAAYETRTDSRTLSALRRASAEASDATGREMAIVDVEFDSTRSNDTGQLVLGLRWTNFSRQTGTRLHADDAFATTEGTWLGSLSENQRLVVVPPREYDSLVGASPAGYEVTNTSLEWTGERTFEPGELSVTYKRTGGATTTPGPGPDDDLDLALFLIPGVVAGFVVVGYLLWAGNADLSIPGAPARTDGDDGPTATDDPGMPEPTAATDDPGAPAGGAPADEELLSDEERVEALLERNGGRMKQANIVKETGWSNAKVSQLLSAMDEADRIDKLRIGRENLISFPDEDVTETDGDSS